MKLLDLFSGIGGFHKGFEKKGYNFKWVGFSEIDKYASAVYKYRFPNAKELGDIAAIRPERDLPDHIDILCGGFPCQAFSQSGLRKGFKDTRGTLFFEIARILRYYKDIGKPIDYFVLENVKGLLSHDNGRTFAIIYGVLADLGYTVECQLLNTKWLLPQNRERIYIVGHIGRGSAAKIFPIKENEINDRKKHIQKIWKSTRQKQNMHDSLRGGRCSINKSKIADFRRDEGIRIRKDNNSPTIATRTEIYLSKTFNIDDDIRRLTPIETERLQGFPDQWTSKGNIDGKVVDISDTQRYRQCGNAVSVPIVELVAEKLKTLINNP